MYGTNSKRKSRHGPEEFRDAPVRMIKSSEGRLSQLDSFPPFDMYVLKYIFILSTFFVVSPVYSVPVGAVQHTHGQGSSSPSHHQAPPHSEQRLSSEALPAYSIQASSSNSQPQAPPPYPERSRLLRLLMHGWGSG